MKVLPKNKHIVIDIIEDEEPETSVLLPSDYQKKKEFVVARVLGVHDSVKDEIKEGSFVVAEPNMVREISIEGQTHYLLQANYVLCEVRL
jgi:co-chaperonin GroES (HSP10)